MKRTLRLYMWGYQQHFAHSLESVAERVFAELGIDLEPNALLVGILKPGEKDNYPLCIEPEDGKYAESLFSNVPARFLEIDAAHPLRNMFYSDARSMEEKPEKIRRASATIAVQEALEAYDVDNHVRSFCGTAKPIGAYYVVPVLQIPSAIFEKFPPLRLPDTGRDFTPKGEQSLIHFALRVLLDEASGHLLEPDPGHNLSISTRPAADIAREAADRFLQIPDFLTGTHGYMATDLFQRLNVISSLFYEGQEGLGSLILAKPDSSFLKYAVRFKTPVPLSEPRWARKVLQMASDCFALICSDNKIHGIGSVAINQTPAHLNIFSVKFLDHYQWELSIGSQPLMYSRYREPKLPQMPIEQVNFISNYLRLFKSATLQNASTVWELFKACTSMSHGTMLVVAEDAEQEAQRLRDQGTPILPALMTNELLHRVSGIDGSILLGPDGQCFAIGVILDGMANQACSPARGSRYNSALRYVESAAANRMAIIVSDDKTIDLIPLLPPQISKQELERRIASFEKASTDGYHADQIWLEKHRFYMREAEATRLNSVIERLDKAPRDVGDIRYLARPFKPSSDMDDSFLF